MTVLRDRDLTRAGCRAVITPAGTLTGDRALHHHLRRSVLDFDTAASFTARLLAPGFTGAQAAPVAGWQTGIVHTFLARNGFTAAMEQTR